jgi:hypothetical protein
MPFVGMPFVGMPFVGMSFVQGLLTETQDFLGGVPWPLSRVADVQLTLKKKKIHKNFLGRIETNENRRRAGELVTLLDEPYLAFLFNNFFTLSCIPCLSLELETGSKLSFLPSKGTSARR